MKVFIIGASGLVGSNCLRHFKEKGWESVGSYFSYQARNTVFFDTLNLGNPSNFDVYSFKPDVIVHCGALTHVDYCEQHEAESHEKTVASTQNMINLSKDLNAKLVFISTDYIFDGINGPYEENAEPHPLSVYGRHKLEAEQAVLAANDGNIVLRITNVYGNEERGKNFVSRIIEQIFEQQKLTLRLPLDQYATPINAYDIARSLFLLLDDRKCGVYHIASTDYMNRVQLALTILKYFPDASYELIPLTTEQIHAPAARPLQGGLKNRKFMSEYPDFRFSTVDDYVSVRSILYEDEE
ncbi:MAG: SDR family oxidoreductase [Sphingobacteriales bacterium]|jgi:dTDP-4-dehydrorhamnose reductase|nr:SDR family oxidoreductase [Sphingobacteriales bacterium]